MPDFLARETGKTTTPGRAFAGYVQDPPPGVHGHLADSYGLGYDSYGRGYKIERGDGMLAITFIGGGKREFAPRERGRFLRELMEAVWDAEVLGRE